MEILDRIEFWHWWVLAVVLVGIEIFAPSTFFLWPAAAAAVVGLLVLAAPVIGWQFQILLFAVLSVISLGAWRVYLRKHPTQTEDPVLNRRAEQIVGRRFTLEIPIVNREGKMKVDDTTWRISGEDTVAGDRVEVVGVDGLTLKVKPVKRHSQFATSKTGPGDETHTPG